MKCRIKRAIATIAKLQPSQASDHLPPKGWQRFGESQGFAETSHPSELLRSGRIAMLPETES